jgi:ATP-binding cassette subfamily B protein
MARAKSIQDALPGLWRILRRFWPWIRPQRRLMAGSLAALFASIGLRLLEPWPLKFVLDRVIPTDRARQHTAVPGIESLDSLTLLTVAAVGLVAIIGLRALMDYYNSLGFTLVSNRALRDLRNHVYAHLQGLSLSYHHRARSGDLIIRVTRDVSLLRDVVSTAMLPLVASLFILVGMAVVMFWLQWRLALLATAIVPCLWLMTVRVSRRIQKAARGQRQREGAMAATAAESISAIKIVQALSLEGMFARDFSSQNNRSQHEDTKTSRLSARLGRTVDVLLGIATAMVLWYGARLVLRAELTAGELVVFLTYLKRAFNPAQDFAKYTGRLAKATAAGERVLNLLDQAPEVHDLPGAVPAGRLQGRIRFDDVSFGYESGRHILQGIDFEVPPGQRVALVGQSGTGKSTLVSLILRLYDPNHGRVLIDGRDVRDFTLASLRSQISVVLQDSLLFAASIRENIAYGAPHSTHGEVEAAARLANAHDFILALPEGYDTAVGERGVTLSHGQRQRITIARAAIRQTPILILDEPTTGLDEENERDVSEALERLAANRTTFLITHDLQRAARADLVLYVENGRLNESGPPAGLMRANGRYAELFRLQTSPPPHPAHETSHVLIT